MKKESLIRNLRADFVMFVQIVLWWPMVFVVYIPLKHLDPVLGTNLFRGLIRVTKRIANR